MRISPARTGRAGILAGLLAAGLALAGCGGPGRPAAAVPSLSQDPGAGATPTAASAADLHAAAQCVRQHGIPGFAEPVRTTGGAVYFDLRSVQDAPASAVAPCRRPAARSSPGPG